MPRNYYIHKFGANLEITIIVTSVSRSCWTILTAGRNWVKGLTLRPEPQTFGSTSSETSFSAWLVKQTGSINDLGIFYLRLRLFSSQKLFFFTSLPILVLILCDQRIRWRSLGTIGSVGKKAFNQSKTFFQFRIRKVPRRHACRDSIRFGMFCRPVVD